MEGKVTKSAVIALLFIAGSIAPCHAQTDRSTDRFASGIARDIDPEIAEIIATVPAIDNHAHPLLPPPNDSMDRNFDALPVDNMEPETDPVAWRPDNPQLTAAWKALWGFEEPVPVDAEGMKRLNAAREAVKSREGQRYAA